MIKDLPKTETEFAVYVASKLQTELNSELKESPFLSGAAVWFTFNNGAIYRVVIDKLAVES